MPDATITSTASTFGTISGVFSADQSTISGTISGIVPGTLTGSVGVPGPAGPGVPAGGTSGQFLQKTSGVDYATDWVTVNLTGLATESWVTAGFYPLTGNPSGFLTSSSLTPYLTKADNLGSLTNFATARDNLGLGSLSSPTFAGITAQGSGANVANLTPTSLSLTHATSGSFTIQPSVGITFPDASVQTTAFTTSQLSNYLAKSSNLSDLPSASTARTNLGLGSLAVVNDAPSDGSQYARKNGAWDVVTTTPDYISSVSSPLSVTSGNLTIDLSAYAQLSGATFTGNVFAPTPSPGTNSTRIATTEWVKDFDYAPTNSPHFTGNPKSVTPSTGDDDTSIATTAFVKAQNYITSAALTGYATESWVTTELSDYLTTASAASTYQTLSGMSDYLTTSAASSTYYPLTNPDNYLTSYNASFLFYPLSSNPAGYLTSAPVTSVAGRTGAITLANTDISGLGTMSTATAADYSTTTVANGLYYPLSSNPAGYLTSAPVTSVAGRTGAITLAVADVSGAAALASPSLTGTPLSTTAAVDTNTTQIATTAFVVAQAASATPLVNGTAAVGTSLRYARADHVHGTDTTRAALASPALTGTPTAPTATAGTNTTQIATTAFVTSAVPAFASLTEARQFSNTTKVLSPSLALWSMFSADIIYIQRSNFTVTNIGSVQYVSAGAISTETRLAAAAASSSRARTFGPSQVDQTQSMTVRANPTSHLNFSRPTYLGGRSHTYNITDPVLTMAFYYGKAEADGVGDLTRRGMGWKVTGGTGSRFLTLEVHNGTTLTSVTSSYAVVGGTAFDWDIIADGTGNVTLYVNGASVATSSAGPTGTHNLTPVLWQEEYSASGVPAITFHTAYHSRGRMAVINY